MKTIRILSIATVLALVVIVGCSLLGKTGAAKTESGKIVPVVAENTAPENEVAVEPVDTNPVTFDDHTPIELTADDTEAEPKPTKVEAVVLDPTQTQAFLTKMNFAEWFASNRDGDAYVYNGFCGKDNYRIEFYFGLPIPIDGNAAVLQVKGKRRYKKQVADFTGRLNIEKVTKICAYSPDYVDFKQHPDYYRNGFTNEDSLNTYYTISGSMNLSEDIKAPNAGSFTGKFFLDTWKVKYDGNHYEYTLYYKGGDSDNIDTADETMDAGILVRGKWNGYEGNSSKDFIAGRYLFGFANNILKSFSYGEREVEINPKYRALGWDDYWENNEWWATDDEKQSSVGL